MVKQKIKLFGYGSSMREPHVLQFKYLIDGPNE